MNWILSKERACPCSYYLQNENSHGKEWLNTPNIWALPQIRTVVCCVKVIPQTVCQKQCDPSRQGRSPSAYIACGMKVPFVWVSMTLFLLTCFLKAMRCCRAPEPWPSLPAKQKRACVSEAEQAWAQACPWVLKSLMSAHLLVHLSVSWLVCWLVGHIIMSCQM